MLQMSVDLTLIGRETTWLMVRIHGRRAVGCMQIRGGKNTIGSEVKAGHNEDKKKPSMKEDRRETRQLTTERNTGIISVSRHYRSETA